MRNKKVIFTFIIISLIIGLIISLTISAYKSQYVGNTKILKTDYQKHLNRTKAFYTYSKQNLSKLTSLDKDTLEEMMSDTLIQNYAANHKITVSSDEINNRYQTAVAGYNKREKISDNGDTKFLGKIKEMYGIGKEDYRQTIKMDLLKEKVQASVGIPLAQWLKAQKK